MRTILLPHGIVPPIRCIERHLNRAVIGAAVAGTVPLVLKGPEDLQLLPGSAPPPAAFFLVEQVLRWSPTRTAVNLAVKLLAGCLDLLTAAGGHQPQCGSGTPQGVSASAAADKQAATAEVYQLACSSLAKGVVQSILHNKQLGASCAEDVMRLSVWSLPLLMEERAAGGTQVHSASSRGSSQPLNLAASLAAAMAAGAYTAHLDAAGLLEHSAGQGGLPADSCSRRTSSSTSCRQDTIRVVTCVTSSSTSCRQGSSQRGAGSISRGSAGASAPSPPGGALADGNLHPEGCWSCWAAATLLVQLRCLERCTVVSIEMATAYAAVYRHEAERRGVNLHQHLQQQLVALAGRHPVPHVCGNVLCARVEGTAAVDAVRSRVGTLCGGCRAAWYCCKECQRAAWEAHREVCRADT
jgi:hypothetical protein